MTNAQHTPTQMARESAARWAKLNGRHQQAANIRRGSCDDAPIVQAFAHHDHIANDLLGEALEALRALQMQALQSTVADPANTWGAEALSMARAVLTKAGKDGQ